MNSHLNRLLKGSAVYGIGSIVQRFLGLLLLPFFTSVVSTEDYGVVALISLISIAFYGIYGLGTGNSLAILYFKEQDLTKRPEIVWSNISLLIINCGAWYLVFFIFSGELSFLIFETYQYSYLIKIALLGSAINTITEPLYAYLRMEEQAKKYVIITFFVTITTIVISIWLVLFEQLGALGLIASTTIANAVAFLVCFLFVGRFLRFRFNKNLVFPLVRIGFPSIFGAFAFLIIDYADRQMIEGFLNLSALGVYSIGYSFGMIMNVFMGAFATAWTPFYMSYINKRKEAEIIFGLVLKYYIIGFGALVILFFATSKIIIFLMTAEPFHEGYKIIGLVASAYALKGCYLIFLPGINFAEKLHKQSIIEWCAAGVNIMLNLILIPIYGITGAAIATFFSYIILPLSAWITSRAYLKVQYDWWGVLYAVSTISSCSLLLYWLQIISEGISLNLIFMNTAITICFFVFSYRVLLSLGERQYLQSKLSIIRN